MTPSLTTPAMTRGGRLVVVAALVGLLGPAAPAALAQSVLKFEGKVLTYNGHVVIDPETDPKRGRNAVQLYLADSGMTGQVVLDLDSQDDPNASSPNCIKLDANIPDPIGGYDVRSRERQEFTGKITVVTSFAGVPCKDMSPENTNARSDTASMHVILSNQSLRARVTVAEEQYFEFAADRVDVDTATRTASPSPSSPSPSGPIKEDNLIELLDPTRIAPGPIVDILFGADCEDPRTNDLRDRCAAVKKQATDFIDRNSPQFANHPQVLKDLSVAVALAGLKKPDGKWAAPALRAFLPSLVLLAASANDDNNPQSAIALTRAINLLATLSLKQLPTT